MELIVLSKPVKDVMRLSDTQKNKMKCEPNECFMQTIII